MNGNLSQHHENININMELQIGMELTRTKYELNEDFYAQTPTNRSIERCPIEF